MFSKILKIWKQNDADNKVLKVLKFLGETLYIVDSQLILFSESVELRTKHIFCAHPYPWTEEDGDVAGE